MPILTLLFALVLGAEPAMGVVGTVVEAEDGSPVPYARIGLPAHAVGAVSAADGSFALDLPADVPVDAEVVFSAPGFASRWIRLEDVADLDVVQLWPRPEGYRVGFAGGGPGSEVGARIPVDGPVFVRGAHFVVSRTGGPRFRYRVNLYALRDGEVAESLLAGSILIDDPQEVGTIDVVLDRHAVIAANDLLLALEWVDDDSGGEEPPLMFRGERTARSNLYQRPNAQAAFRKITARDVTPAFYLTVIPVPGHEPRAAPAAVPIVADVISARAIPGDDGTVFEVGLESPDTGCGQYADWWEVLDDKGRLLVRRILRHSHVGEQPFVRASDPVRVDTDATLWIRGHMHPTGYGGLAMHGTVAGGFVRTELDPESFSGLSDRSPLPSDCRF